MIDVEKQIEEVIQEVVDAAMQLEFCIQRDMCDIAARDDLEVAKDKLLTLLSSAQSGEQAAPQAVQAAVPVDVVTDLKNALADATEILQQLRLMEEHARGDVWRWQADAANELATMGNRMGVLILASALRNLLAAPAHPAEGVPAPMPVAHPHHCTARTADGSCEECECHSQAMAEWNAERTALAATQPAAQWVATTGYIAPKGRYVPPVLFSPYTGEPRDARDIASDPHGILIVPPGTALAAQPNGEV